MFSAADIKNIKFARSMSGYKQEEVDIFLDKVEADYVQFDNIEKAFNAKIDSLNKEISDLKEAQSSIQNVLLTAQRLADNIIGEAKEKSEEILKAAESNLSVIQAHEKELATAFEIKAQERKNTLEKELSKMVSQANKKAQAITSAADDAVKRQQLLFDKLKLEIAAFKAGITAKYKEHLETLSSIPDTVPAEPAYLAEVVSATFDKEPDVNKFINNGNLLSVENDDVSEEADIKFFSKSNDLKDISSNSQESANEEGFQIEMNKEEV